MSSGTCWSGVSGGRRSRSLFVFRFRIVLAAATGRLRTGFAEKLGVNLSTTVGRWPALRAGRADSLHDEPRRRRLRTISDEQLERVTFKTWINCRNDDPTPLFWPRPPRHRLRAN
jgi:hypothetical protein